MGPSIFTTASGMSWLLACSLKAALLLVASWLGAQLLRRSSAAARHQIWALGVLGALLLPLLCWAVPAMWAWSLPAQTSTIVSTGPLVAPVTFVTPGPAPTAVPAWPTWLALVWAAGAAAVGCGVVRAHHAARRLARAADPQVPDTWTRLLREIGGMKHIELRRSGAIGSPMTIGVLRPRVLLPVAAETWSAERVRAVLVHELGHVRRRDTVIQLAAQLACTLYWWNPFAWLAAARLRIEREHACDDLVLDAGILPSSYATDLLEVVRTISNQAHAGSAAICMADHGAPELRVRRILDATTTRRPLRARARLMSSGLALGCAVTLACTSSPPAVPPSRVGTLLVGAPYVRSSPAPSAAPDGSPFLRDPFARPASQGAVDLSLVETEVKHRLGELEQCYRRRLAVNPALSGTVVIHWVITETGDVPDACITKDTIGDHELTACVNQLVLHGARFPAPRGGSVDVELPLVFSARG